MPRMIELIRQSAVPTNIMRSAARGALSLPPAEMLEILVELTSNPLFSEQARLTLAAWDANSARNVLCDPDSPVAVLEYFSRPENLRTVLLPVLLENPSVSEQWLEKLATSRAEALSFMIQSPRVHRSPKLLDLLLHDSSIPWHMDQQAQEELAGTAGSVVVHRFELAEVQQYLIEHEEEIRAAEHEPFHLIGITVEESAELAAAKEAAAPAAGVSEAVAKGDSANTAAAEAPPEGEEEKLTLIQRIARMTVGQRVMLALKGGRDDRFILVRDGVRVVSNAVLESPKLNEQEVEAYASMKNVSENVLRSISMKRKWIRHYAIVRALTRNSRTPVDVSVPLMKGLHITDLKSLASNKDIPEAARKLAFKLMRDRMEQRNR